MRQYTITEYDMEDYEDYNVIVTMFSSDDNYAQNLISGDGVTVKYKREDLSQVNPQLYKWLAIINDKSSTNNIVSQNNIAVNDNIRNNSENNQNQADNSLEDDDITKTDINSNMQSFEKERKKLYDVYRRMKDRCYNSKEKDYKYYGGKGVKIDGSWLRNFDAFFSWAINSGYKEGLTIDRVDPDGNYEPSNCRWATTADQNKNKSNSNNSTDENTHKRTEGTVGDI